MLLWSSPCLIFTSVRGGKGENLHILFLQTRNEASVRLRDLPGVIQGAGGRSGACALLMSRFLITVPRATI